MKSSRWILVVGAVLGLAALPAVLSRCSGKQAHPEHPVVLIGVDGMEWKVLGPLLKEGRMPNLQKLIERGTLGNLITFKNMALSPVIWTSIATGTTSNAHGITNFLDPAGTPFTSNSRRGKALWNIASDYGLRTLCVGWWVTYPAEEIRGTMVAPYSSAGQNTLNWKGNLRPDLADQTWPRDLIKSVYPIAERINDPANFHKNIAAPYFEGVDPKKITPLENEIVSQALWSVAADETFAAVAVELLHEREKNPNLTMVYMGGPDVSSHRFWRYRTPEEFQYTIPDESVSELKEIIHRFYMRTDQLIGNVLAAAPQDANVIVCSDHGFHATNTDKPDPRGLSGHHMDGPPGVIIAAGPEFKTGNGKELLAALATTPRLQLPPLGSVLEVAPTMLYLLDIPAGRNMANPQGGKLLKSLVAPEALARRPIADAIESHDIGFRPPSQPISVSEGDTKGIQEWMKQNGYLAGGQAVDVQLNVPKDEEKGEKR